jgi:hypothetical protein
VHEEGKGSADPPINAPYSAKMNFIKMKDQMYRFTTLLLLAMHVNSKQKYLPEAKSQDKEGV